MGYNRYFGRYKDADPADKFGEWLDSCHNARKTRPICVSEFGGGAATTQFKDNIDWQAEIDPWGERHYQNYQSAMHEKIWAQFAERKYLWGKFITFADSSLKVVVSITIDNCFAVHDIKIIQGNDRLFAAMPSRKDNDIYRDIVHPINAAARQKLEDIILTAYIAHIDIMESGGEINGY